MRAYSLDVRERVLAAIAAGTQRAQVAATFRVSERTMLRWVTRQQAEVAGWPVALGQDDALVFLIRACPPCAPNCQPTRTPPVPSTCGSGTRSILP